MYTFHNTYRMGNKMEGEFSLHQIKNEPMFFNASLQYAWDKGGPITRSFLTALGMPPGAEAVLDSRTHMLMPGWLPAIPGWHHDDVPRTRGDGQPNYENPEYYSEHAMALVNADVAPTEFVIGTQELPPVPLPSGPVYKVWNEMTNIDIEAGRVAVEKAPNQRVVFFDWQAMHRAVPAVKFGWRWFARVSWSTDRRPTNEIRSQTQVYLPVPEEGW